MNLLRMYYPLTGKFRNDTFNFYCIRLITQVTEYTQPTAHAVRKYIIITQSSTSISILTAVQNNFIKNKQHLNHTVRVGLGKGI